MPLSATVSLFGRSHSMSSQVNGKCCHCLGAGHLLRVVRGVAAVPLWQHYRVPWSSFRLQELRQAVWFETDHGGDRHLLGVPAPNTNHP